MRQHQQATMEKTKARTNIRFQIHELQMHFLNGIDRKWIDVVMPQAFSLTVELATRTTQIFCEKHYIQSDLFATPRYIFPLVLIHLIYLYV